MKYLVKAQHTINPGKVVCKLSDAKNLNMEFTDDFIKVDLKTAKFYFRQPIKNSNDVFYHNVGKNVLEFHYGK